jgi:hypothetical protein
MNNSTAAGLVLIFLLVAVFSAYFFGFPMHTPWQEGMQ